MLFDMVHEKFQHEGTFFGLQETPIFFMMQFQ